MARKHKQQKQNKKSPKRPPVKEANRIQNPHDSFFRSLFSVIEYVRQFIEGFLPSEVVDLFVLDSLTYLKETYTDEKLAQHMTDMLFQISLQGQLDDEGKPQTAEIYLLFDHKSHPESTILEQFLRYMNQRWQFDRENGVKPRVIIPIVFYHGKEGWHVKRKFANTFEHVDPALHKFIPNFEYILINVGKTPDKKIEQLVSSGALQSGLLALKYIFDKELESKLIQILTPLQRARLTMEKLRPYLESVLRYLSGTKNPVSDEAITKSVRTVFAEEAEIMDTIFERLAERSREEGIEIGLKEAERKFDQERRKTLAHNRETILGIVNHALRLDEEEQAKMSKQLEQIGDEEILRELINSALDAAFGGDFTFFMMKLGFESASDTS
ncbi:MAG: Rpn family recombination-promoting nuclease/putative transposase [Chloroflexota bacterium]